jgi:ariadne-1
MVCAAPWKTCSCPWFNYNHIDDGDRLNDMRVPYMAHDNVVEVVEMPHNPAPVRRSTSTRTRHRSDRERTEDDLAAHLQAQLRMESGPTASELRRANPSVQMYGLGNSGGHHMNESYSVRPLATSAARTAVRNSAPRTSFFSRRLSREPPPPPPPVVVRTAKASTMAGLSRDGKKVGANRVGTWLSHVQLDAEAIHTAPRDVEVDDWRVEGTMIGID